LILIVIVLTADAVLPTCSQRERRGSVAELAEWQWLAVVELAGQAVVRDVSVLSTSMNVLKVPTGKERVPWVGYRSLLRRRSGRLRGGLRGTRAFLTPGRPSNGQAALNRLPSPMSRKAAVIGNGKTRRVVPAQCAA